MQIGRQCVWSSALSPRLQLTTFHINMHIQKQIDMQVQSLNALISELQIPDRFIVPLQPNTKEKYPSVQHKSIIFCLILSQLGYMQSPNLINRKIFLGKILRDSGSDECQASKNGQFKEQII